MTFLIDNILQPEFGTKDPRKSKKKSAEQESADDLSAVAIKTTTTLPKQIYPAWVYCTRYSDRPSCAGEQHCEKQIIRKLFEIYSF
jgi:hypothetical protein